MRQEKRLKRASFISQLAILLAPSDDLAARAYREHSKRFRAKEKP